MNKNIRPFIYLFFVSSVLFSCKSVQSVKDLPYFKDFTDSMASMDVQLAAYTEPVIQKQDILNINIDSRGTLSSGPNTNIINASEQNGYLVNESGAIVLPIFGKIHVAGMTTSALQTLLQSKADYLYKNDDTYKNSVVTVKYAGIKVGVLGEVGSPGIKMLTTEKNTVLDAIMAAGDLTVYGKRNNIVLMRDSAGVRKMYHLDINKTSLMSSPYFYLKQNDVIIVNPIREKGQAIISSAYVNISIGISILSFVLVLLSVVK